MAKGELDLVESQHTLVVPEDARVVGVSGSAALRVVPLGADLAALGARGCQAGALGRGRPGGGGLQPRL